MVTIEITAGRASLHAITTAWVLAQVVDRRGFDVTLREVADDSDPQSLLFRTDDEPDERRIEAEGLVAPMCNSWPAILTLNLEGYKPPPAIQLIIDSFALAKDQKFNDIDPFIGYVAGQNRNFRNWELLAKMNQAGIDKARTEGEVAYKALVLSNSFAQIFF